MNLKAESALNEWVSKWVLIYWRRSVFKVFNRGCANRSVRGSLVCWFNLKCLSVKDVGLMLGQVCSYHWGYVQKHLWANGMQPFLMNLLVLTAHKPSNKRTENTVRVRPLWKTIFDLILLRIWHRNLTKVELTSFNGGVVKLPW